MTEQQPRGVVELRDISMENKMIAKVEEFVGFMETMHTQVKHHLEKMNNTYKEKADKKRRHKEFALGEKVMVYLRKERFLVGTYKKLKMKRFCPCKIIRKFHSSNADKVKLLEEFGISPIFNIANLYQYHEGESLEDKEVGFSNQISQHPKEIEEILCNKVGCSTRGTQYKEYIVRWKGRLEEDSS